MKRTIEIDDCLDEHIDSAIADVRTELENYLHENNPDSLPDIGDLDYSGAIHEIIDGSVPIYTHAIKCLWFLYGSELEQAYENAGIGDNPMENDGMAAIYCLIQERVYSWYHDNAEDEVFQPWRDKQDEVDAIELLDHEVRNDGIYKRINGEDVRVATFDTTGTSEEVTAKLHEVREQLEAEAEEEEAEEDDDTTEESTEQQ